MAPGLHRTARRRGEGKCTEFSDIQDKIESYHSGLISFDTLKYWLIRFPFKTPVYDEWEPDFDQPDTWDDVESAEAAGMLTEEELNELRDVVPASGFTGADRSKEEVQNTQVTLFSVDEP